MNNFDEKINYLLAEIDSLTRRVNSLEKTASILVDDELDESSSNAIQNRTVFSALSNKIETSDFSSHTDDADNPHAVTKSQIGLSEVDNTADNAKNVLSATKLFTPRTIANVSFDGTSNIDISYANLTNKPTTLLGYGISDAAKNDASNLTNENILNWQTTCGYERVDTLYDYLSSASSKNWGYTNGIQGGVTISGKDFSKYKSLRIHFIKNYGSSNGVGNIYHVILSKYGIDSSSTYIGGCLIPNGSSKTSDAFWSISKVDATKTSFNHYGAGYGTVTENASGRIFRIEGIY